MEIAVEALAAVDQALLAACLEGSEAAVSQAVAMGADPCRARDPMGATVVHMAAIGGHVATAKWCLDRGASATTADAQGVLPLHAACYGGSLAMVEWLMEGAPRRQQQQRRDDDEERRSVRAASLGAMDAQGGTPLHHAALGGRCSVARWLLFHGADERAVTVDGLTAERVALEAGEAAMVKLLRCYSRFRAVREPDRPTELPPPFVPATAEHPGVVAAFGGPALLAPHQQPLPNESASGGGAAQPSAGALLNGHHQGPGGDEDEEDEMDAEEREALAEAEREAEQFRQAEMRRLIAEEDERRRAEGSEAAARLVAAEKAQQREDSERRRLEKEAAAAAAKSSEDEKKEDDDEEDSWLKRYQAECARREAERHAAQPADDDDEADGPQHFRRRPKPQEKPHEPEEKDPEPVPTEPRVAPAPAPASPADEPPARVVEDEVATRGGQQESEGKTTSAPEPPAARIDDRGRDHELPPAQEAPPQLNRYEPDLGASHHHHHHQAEWRPREAAADETNGNHDEDRSRRRRREGKRSRRHRDDDDSDGDRSRRRARRSRRRRDDSPSPPYHRDSYRDPRGRPPFPRRQRGPSPASRSAMKQLAEAAKAGAIQAGPDGSKLWGGAMALYSSSRNRD